MDPSGARAHGVLVVCNYPLFVRGLAALIDESPELSLVGTATSAVDGFRKMQQLRPSLLLIQASLVDLFRAQWTPGCHAPRTIMLGSTPHPGIREAENGNWVCAFLKPTADLRETHQVMLAIANCEQRLDSHGGGCDECVVHRSMQMPQLPISGRELEVFYRIGCGEGTSQIAEAMGVSVKTIETYRENIKHKLGLGSAHALSAAALHWREGEGALDEIS